MKHIDKIIFCALFCTFSIFASAQVKQIYRVFDYDTKKPLQGAENELYGVKFSTDANGIAVANLPADKKGAFLPFGGWKLDGYLNLGKTEESFFKYNQSKDTLKYYLVKTGKYRAERNRLFGNLYRKWYNDKFLPYYQKDLDSIRILGINAYYQVDNLMGVTWDQQSSVVKSCYGDSKDANKYSIFEFNKPKYAEILEVLNSGDVEKATKMAKEKVRKGDLSDENVDLIDFYRTLHHLSLSFDDDTISNYTEVIYKKYKDSDHIAKYLFDLTLDGRFEVGDSIVRIAKGTINNPLAVDDFIPGLFQNLVNFNANKLKPLADGLMNNCLNNNMRYHCSKTEEKLLFAYQISIRTYAALGDSAKTAQLVNEAFDLILRKRNNDGVDSYGSNMNLLEDGRALLNYNQYAFSSRYFDPEKLQAFTDSMYKALKTNYLSDPNSLLHQLVMSEYGFNLVAYVDPGQESGFEILDLVYDASKRLSEEFPEYYAIFNTKLASQLLGNALVKSKAADELESAFSKYEESFDIANAKFPNAFITRYLEFNSSLEGYLSANQIFELTDKLGDFTNRLLAMKAKINNRDLNAEKAANMNRTAEKLYSDQLYEESVAYYLKANELYEKSLDSEETLWEPYLINHLQMGDAHLNLNQFDKAITTYQKIFDFEKHIPASQLPMYQLEKGSAHYYIGDAYKSQNNMKVAEKEYKLAEKDFLKAVSMGNTDAYINLGEMYLGKAVTASQNQELKKCVQLVEKSVNYYERADMRRPYKRYENAKTANIEFKKQAGDAGGYYKNVAEYVEYCKKFVPYDNNYAANVFDYSNVLIRDSKLEPGRKLEIATDMVNSVIVLGENGQQVDRFYLFALYTLAQAYSANDSIVEAIDLYRDCLNVSEHIYSDTAQTTWKSYMADVYEKIAVCYERMAEKIDTAHSERWYYKSVDTRDTLIDILKEFAAGGDVKESYKLALQYRNNGMLFNRLDMVVSALDYFDKSNYVLKQFYESEYKKEVENDIIRNYALKGFIYSDNGEEEKALENLTVAKEYIAKAETRSIYFNYVLSELLKILEKDSKANASEISRIKKMMK